jgi:hypothetical protein
VANGVAKACWLQKLLQELHALLSKSTPIYYDNISIVYHFTNPIQHQRTKHVEIDHHFIWECVAISDVCVLHIPTTSKFTDIFTKGLPTLVFLDFWSVSTFIVARVLTVGGCWKMRCNIGTWVWDHLLREA